ncbi:hypothetical protein PF008_g10309 [Phytophthora fragariae]|uniref:Uncharacterized protein n=1 Tax=Phytophthora fragariae TaxID=53985 RepID=A0A6G0RUL2_9STRA|nr:hypothetical protein PF008_g10309 [Phytophthora fragariae]
MLLQLLLIGVRLSLEILVHLGILLAEADSNTADRLEELAERTRDGASSGRLVRAL